LAAGSSRPFLLGEEKQRAAVAEARTEEKKKREGFPGSPMPTSFNVNLRGEGGGRKIQGTLLCGVRRKGGKKKKKERRKRKKRSSLLPHYHRRDQTGKKEVLGRRKEKEKEDQCPQPHLTSPILLI